VWASSINQPPHVKHVSDLSCVLVSLRSRARAHGSVVGNGHCNNTIAQDARVHFRFAPCHPHHAANAVVEQCCTASGEHGVSTT